MIPLYRLTLVVILSVASVAGFAAVPSTLNYQGYLTDPSGPATDVDTTITFAIYNVDRLCIPIR